MVTVCMLRKEENTNIFTWDVDDVISVSEYEKYKDFVAEIALLYQKYYVEEEEIYITEEYDRNCTNIFKDKHIIEIIVNYLRGCREKYFKMEMEYKEDSRESKISKMIRSLYKHSQNDGGEKGLEFQMMEQQEFIEEYKTDLFSASLTKEKEAKV